MKIHIARFGETFGPYTEEALRDYLADGSLSGEDLAWADGWASWVELDVLLDNDPTKKALVVELDNTSNRTIEQQGKAFSETTLHDSPQPSPEPPGPTDGPESHSLDMQAVQVATGEKLKRDLSGRFASKKNQFLVQLEGDLKKRIEAKGKQNLVLIEKHPGGERTFPPSRSMAYCKRLIAFARQRKFEGNELDVALTAHVVGIVTEHFQVLYSDDEDEIAEAVTEAILKNDIAAKTLVETVIETSTTSRASEIVKQQIAELVLVQLRSALHGASIKSILTGIAKYALAKPAGVIVLKTLAVNLKVIVAKVLATASLKTLILASMKKFLVATVLGYIARVLAVKLGIATVVSKTGVLIPLVIAFIAWEIHRFSRKLGISVAKKVTQELDGHYEEIHADVIDRVVVEVFSTGIKTIARDLGRSAAFQNGLDDLLSEAKP